MYIKFQNGKRRIMCAHHVQVRCKWMHSCSISRNFVPFESNIFRIFQDKNRRNNSECFPTCAREKLNSRRSLSATERRTIHVQVRCEWVQLCIAAEDAAVLQDALAFARESGRMKFVRPLYQSLHLSTIGRAAGLQQFLALHPTLHPIARKMVAADLGVTL